MPRWPSRLAGSIETNLSKPAILAIDAGTTSVTALLVDHDGVVVGRGYRGVESYYPFPGWVEQDAEQIWLAVQSAVAESFAAAPDHTPSAVGVANQRETCLFWDRRTGKPLHRAIVWQCRRSAEICNELRAQGVEPEIERKTGLRLDPYFSGTKALWLTRTDATLPTRIKAGDVAFGTVDSWLVHRLSAGSMHVTDTTNACRTLAFDIHRLDWDDSLLERFGLRRAVMAEVAPSASVRGQTAEAGPIEDGIPIASLSGDQQAALYGQACFERGQVKATYGTGCFILMHTGDKPAWASHGLLTTLAASGDGAPAYAIEGSVFAAGSAMEWSRENLGFNVDQASKNVGGSGGVVFVPAFVGLGSPHWAADVRGTIYGLTRGTTASQIGHAALESIVFQAQDVLEVLRAEFGAATSDLRVDGGAASNDALMQLQADLAGVAISRSRSVETTALGAAYLAGLAVRFWSDEQEIRTLRDEERRFLPSENAGSARQLYGRWKAAIGALLKTDLPPLDKQI
jgi:glycerol kinase